MKLADIAIDELLPHARPMVLLDEVTAVSENALSARLTVRGDGMFDEATNAAKTVPALVGVEYMAQTVAAWAGYHARRRGEAVGSGLLLGARDYHSSTTAFTVGETLDVNVALVLQSAAGLAVFDCTIENERFAVSARLTVITVDSLDSNEPD